MKKYLRYADVFVLSAGMVGLLLRLILMLVGTDERGLYPADHPAWIILCILSVLVVAAIFMLTGNAGTEESFERNYPASLPGAIGCGLGAVGVLVTAIGMLEADILSVLASLLGVAGAVLLALTAFCRFGGKKPHFATFAVLCGFFAVRAFLLGRVLGAEPETCRYLFEMLACLAMVPACYQLWGFAVDAGNRSKGLFWSLTAAYLCMVGVLSQGDWLLHLTMAAWLMTNLCPLVHMDKQPEPAQEPEEPAQAPENEAPADPVEEFNAKAILAEIMKEIEQTET